MLIEEFKNNIKVDNYVTVEYEGHFLLPGIVTCKIDKEIGVCMHNGIENCQKLTVVRTAW